MNLLLKIAITPFILRHVIRVYICCKACTCSARCTPFGTYISHSAWSRSLNLYRSLAYMIMIYHRKSPLISHINLHYWYITSAPHQRSENNEVCIAEITGSKWNEGMPDLYVSKTSIKACPRTVLTDRERRAPFF
jgi:hypothetical protein